MEKKILIKLRNSRNSKEQLIILRKIQKPKRDLIKFLFSIALRPETPKSIHSLVIHILRKVSIEKRIVRADSSALIQLLKLITLVKTQEILEPKLPQLIKWIHRDEGAAIEILSSLPILILEHPLMFTKKIRQSIEEQFVTWLMKASLDSAHNKLWRRGPTPCLEMDGSTCQNFFTVLNFSNCYTHDQKCNVLTFSLIHRWLRTFRDLSILGESIVKYCIRVINQSLKIPVNEQDILYRLDRHLQFSVQLEASRILSLIGALDETYEKRITNIFRKLYNKTDIPCKLVIIKFLMIFNHRDTLELFEELLQDPGKILNKYEITRFAITVRKRIRSVLKRNYLAMFNIAPPSMLNYLLPSIITIDNIKDVFNLCKSNEHKEIIIDTSIGINGASDILAPLLLNQKSILFERIAHSNPLIIINNSLEILKILESPFNENIEFLIILISLIGDYFSPNISSISNIQISQFYDVLEAMVYENDNQRLLLIIFSTLTKLASRLRNLVPKALLLFSKFSNNKNLLISKISFQNFNILKNPSILGSICEPFDYLFHNSSLPFHLIEFTNKQSGFHNFHFR